MGLFLKTSGTFPAFSEILVFCLAKSDIEECVPVEHFRYFRKYFCFNSTKSDREGYCISGTKLHVAPRTTVNL